jgi:outer membrane receptor protein involved in Fe transport
MYEEWYNEKVRRVGNSNISIKLISTATNDFVISSDPVAGYMPAYTVFDASATFRIKRYSLKAGINNIVDKKYFTVRSDEYPGPGIMPHWKKLLYWYFR